MATTDVYRKYTTQNKLKWKNIMDFDFLFRTIREKKVFNTRRYGTNSLHLIVETLLFAYLQRF